MTVTDWVLTAALLFAVCGGWRWGTINVIARIGSLILAYQTARVFAVPAASYAAGLLPGLTGLGRQEGGGTLSTVLTLLVDPESAGNRFLEIVAFIIIFVIVCWLVRRIANALTGLFGRGLLGQINRALGAFCAFILMAAFILILNDIVLPVLAVLGLPSQPLDFLADSAWVLPALKELQAVF